MMEVKDSLTSLAAFQREMTCDVMRFPSHKLPIVCKQSTSKLALELLYAFESSTGISSLRGSPTAALLALGGSSEDERRNIPRSLASRAY